MKGIQTFDEQYVHLLIWISVSLPELPYLSRLRLFREDSFEIMLQAVKGTTGPINDGAEQGEAK